MAIASVKRRHMGLAVIGLLLAALLVALHMMSGAVQQTESLNRWFVPLLVFVICGISALVAVLAYNLFQLVRDLRRGVAGARLTKRMVFQFVVLVLAPAAVLYYYSLQFLVRGIDSWFDVQVDTAMEDALRLSRASLDLHKRQLINVTENVLDRLEDSSQAGLTLSLGEMLELTGATELTLMGDTGAVLASASHDLEQLVPETPDVSILTQLVQDSSHLELKRVGESLQYRVLARDPRGRELFLQAIYPVPETLNQLSGNVGSAYVTYKRRHYLRDSIKFTFAMMLSLVMLVALFAAIWLAFFSARKLAAPISALAEGTRAVAAGDYDSKVPEPAERDELGFLVSSFNIMTKRVRQARDAYKQSQEELANQHAYLEQVLGSVSTGVLTLDGDGRVQTANPVALDILRLSADELLGHSMDSLVENHSQLLPLADALREGICEHSDWRQEVTLYRSEGRQALMCGLSPLESGAQLGFVLVIDEITALVKAQRDAAWGEVARRLAHEIKNPLTPIQLSAERVRRKCLPQAEGSAGEVLDRATRTIVQQVEAMKAMVNAFSDYAKPSKSQSEPLVFDRFIGDVMALYEGNSQVGFIPGAADILVRADGVRLRQVVHNLVKNGLEAIAGRPDGRVDVITGAVEAADRHYVELIVGDNGPGFEPARLGAIFDPYVTNKERGTGLGLAIVKKIAEEHGGAVRAENRAQGGGQVVVRIPAELGSPQATPKRNSA